MEFPRLMTFFALTVLLFCSGCTMVEPWERDYLAREDMAFEPDPLETISNDQVYTSKEAAAGGRAVGGGGCGCN
ncbi:MAG: DUF4266 domain-containing protein [Magnetococcales bacterium]|nr:DUF4266 domain-containing protein [Magnetococcales bacterium]